MQTERTTTTPPVRWRPAARPRPAGDAAVALDARDGADGCGSGRRGATAGGGAAADSGRRRACVPGRDGGRRRRPLPRRGRLPGGARARNPLRTPWLEAFDEVLRGDPEAPGGQCRARTPVDEALFLGAARGREGAARRRPPRPSAGTPEGGAGLLPERRRATRYVREAEALLAGEAVEGERRVTGT